MNFLSKLILSSDATRATHIKRSLLATLNYVVSAVLVTYVTLVTQADFTYAAVLIAAMFANALLFYWLIRSGSTAKYSDPALTLPQIYTSMMFVLLQYPVLVSCRGASLILLVQTMLYGLFSLKRPQFVTFAAVTICALATWLTFLVFAMPDQFPLYQEVTNFIFVSCTILTFLQIAGQLEAMRAKLRARKEELATALLHAHQFSAQDDLTGLHNRKFVMEALEMQRKLFVRRRTQFTVAVVEVDQMDMVEKQYGEAVAAGIFCEFAKMLQEKLRPGDIIGRWDNKTVIMVFAECPLIEAMALFDRLRAAFYKSRAHSNYKTIDITFTAGFSEYERGDVVPHTVQLAIDELNKLKKSK